MFSEATEEFFFLCMSQVNYDSFGILIRGNCLMYDWTFVTKIKSLYSENGQKLFCLKGFLLSVALFEKMLFVINCNFSGSWLLTFNMPSKRLI